MSREDREMLALAAKAAGIELMWAGPIARECRRRDNCARWNSLEDDGDAARLAAALRIDLAHDQRQVGLLGAWVMASVERANGRGSSDTIRFSLDVSDERARAACVRRVVTEVAAEMARPKDERQVEFDVRRSPLGG